MLWHTNWYIADGWATEEDPTVEPLPAYTFEPLPGEPDPLLILKATSCYGYQTGDGEGYDLTEAHGFISRLEAYATSRLPGRDALPWVIESKDVFLEAAARREGGGPTP